MVNHGGDTQAIIHGMNYAVIHAPTCLVVGYCHKWQYPNNHPLCHLCGQLSSCFFSTCLHSAALRSLPFRERLWPSFQVLAKPFNHQSHPSTPLLTPKDHFNQMVCHISSEECLTLVSGTTSPFKHINHAWPGMIY